MKYSIILFVILKGAISFTQIEFNLQFEETSNRKDSIEAFRILNLSDSTYIDFLEKTESDYAIDFSTIKNIDTLKFIIETTKYLYLSKIPRKVFEEGHTYQLSIISYRKLLFCKYFNLLLTSNKNELSMPFFIIRKNKK